jgi:hypothetical protein
MKLAILAVLSMIIPLTVSASSLEVDGFNGKIIASDDINLADGDFSFNVQWYCVKPAWRPMSSSGWDDCGSEYRGKESIKIDSAGNFSFPGIDVSGPWFRGVFVVQIDLEKNGQKIQDLGAYGGKDYFVPSTPVSRIEGDLKALNIVLIKGDKYPVNIIARETGMPDIEFNDITTRYPDSFNQGVEIKLSFTYDKTAGMARTNPWHQTFSRRINGEYENGSYSFSDTLWAISGFKEGTSIEVGMKFSVGVGLVRNGVHKYKSTRLDKQTTISATQSIDIPTAPLLPASEVILSLD